MESLIIICISTSICILYGAIEFYNHQKNVEKIKIRIHVNGTRGKSSVTRLIGAGLRAAGYNTITKVTGTFPRLILNDGSETPVYRKNGANIIEQLNIVRFAAQQKADVLLIECMALNPINQWITEHQMIKATQGVITNIRLDHLDVMGPGLMDVANALSKTIPKQSLLFTAEVRLLDFLIRRASSIGTKVFASKGCEVEDTAMEGFSYIEHKENVALALSICCQLGVSRDLALSAMKLTMPDEGVLKKSTIRTEDHPVHFYNALAANDPESSIMLWDLIQNLEGQYKQYMVLINARNDRKERSEQLTAAAAELQFDRLILTGENVQLVKSMALDQGIPEAKIIAIGQGSPAYQVNQIKPSIQGESVIVAFGNMGAGGAELNKYFETQKTA